MCVGDVVDLEFVGGVDFVVVEVQLCGVVRWCVQVLLGVGCCVECLQVIVLCYQQVVVGMCSDVVGFGVLWLGVGCIGIGVLV